MNILMCSHQDHTKPPLDVVAPLLQQLIGFNKGNKGSLVLSCIGQLCPNPLVSQISKSRTPTLEPETCFDSTTGKVRIIDLEEKIPEPTDQPVYLVQLMKLGEVVFLAFFDRVRTFTLWTGTSLKWSSYRWLTSHQLRSELLVTQR